MPLLADIHPSLPPCGTFLPHPTVLSWLHSSDASRSVSEPRLHEAHSSSFPQEKTVLTHTGPWTPHGTARALPLFRPRPDYAAGPFAGVLSRLSASGSTRKGRLRLGTHCAFRTPRPAAGPFAVRTCRPPALTTRRSVRTSLVKCDSCLLHAYTSGSRARRLVTPERTDLPLPKKPP